MDPTGEIINTRLSTATMIKATAKRVDNDWYYGILKVTPANEEPYEVILREPAPTRKDAIWLANEVRRAFIRAGGLPQRQEGV